MSVAAAVVVPVTLAASVAIAPALAITVAVALPPALAVFIAARLSAVLARVAVLLLADGRARRLDTGLGRGHRLYGLPARRCRRRIHQPLHLARRGRRRGRTLRLRNHPLTQEHILVYRRGRRRLRAALLGFAALALIVRLTLALRLALIRLAASCFLVGVVAVTAITVILPAVIVAPIGILAAVVAAIVAVLVTIMDTDTTVVRGDHYAGAGKERDGNQQKQETEIAVHNSREQGWIMQAQRQLWPRPLVGTTSKGKMLTE